MAPGKVPVALSIAGLPRGSGEIPVKSDALLTQQFQVVLFGQRRNRRLHQQRRPALAHGFRCLLHGTIVSGLERDGASSRLPDSVGRWIQGSTAQRGIRLPRARHWAFGHLC